MKRSLFLALSVAGATTLGCPPNLDGEPCDPVGQDCPTGQTCQLTSDGGAVCVASSGTASGTTSSTSSGTTSSSSGTTSGSSGTAAIFGTVTLNSGAPLPSGNTAIVYAFKSVAGLDGGLGATPDLIANVQDGGAYSFGDAGAGAYFLAAYYEFTNANGTRVAYSQSAVSASSTPVDLDIPTYACTVAAAISSGVEEPRLLGVSADIRDVSSGAELPTGVTASVYEPGSVLGTTPLTFLGAGGNGANPLFINQWGLTYQGDLRDKPDAGSTYAIAIAAPGYGSGATCSAPLGTAPPLTPTTLTLNGSSLPLSTWTRSMTNTVGWTVTGTPFDAEFVSVHSHGTTATSAGDAYANGSQLLDGGVSAAFAGNIVPLTDCPVTGGPTGPACVIEASFFDGVATGLTGTYFLGYAQQLSFQTD